MPKLIGILDYLAQCCLDTKLIIFLDGTGASSNDSEVIFGNNEQSFDIQTNVNHESPSTEGRVVEKSILRNKSKSLFQGND